MSSYTDTATVTTNAADVRQIMAMATTEITTIAHTIPQGSCDFDVDAALCDCSIFVLNDVIDAIQLQIYLDTQIVREYRYQIVTGSLTPYGPPANQPPLGYVPPGARIRLTVSTNPNVSWDYAQAWYRRLGWQDVEPLDYPPNTHYVGYGNFVSGGLGLDRQMLSNPNYDRAVQGSGRSSSMQKR
jgi:hypothetical protein